MAFRSELESARDRAEAAEAEVKRLEHELASQRARIERVAEVESQLEAARAAARVRGDVPLGTWLLRMAIPLVVGAGGVGLYAQSQLARSAEEAAAQDALHERERANLEGEVHRARFEAERAASLREDELRASHRSSERELQRLFPVLVPGGRLEIGVVESTDGDAPTSPGVRCHVESHSDEACWASVVCGATIVHRVGCASTVETALLVIEPTDRLTVSGHDWSAHIRLTRDPVPGPLGWE